MSAAVEMVCAYCHGVPPKPDTRGLVQPCLCALPGYNGPKVSRPVAAWADAERLTDIAVQKDAIWARADDDRRRAHDAASEAWAKAEAIGPRPAKVPT